MINGGLWLTLFNGTEDNKQTRPDSSNVSTLLVFPCISSFWGEVLPGSGAFVHVNKEYTSYEKNQYTSKARENQY